MTPPTQSDARWEPPEWLKEVAARAIDDAAMGGLDGYRDEDPDRLPRLAKAAFRAVLVECPVLGLTREEVDSLMPGSHLTACPRWQDLNQSCDCGLDSARAKLLATREALERGGE